jgi:hypothetical protein
MGINPAARIVVAITIFMLAIWLGLVMLEVPRDISKGVGTCLFIFGVLNLLLRRRHARQLFNLCQAKNAKLLRVWFALGRSGIEFLFTAIGIILIVSGIAFWFM